MNNLEDQIWMLTEEMRAFLAIAGQRVPERIIDVAAPGSWLAEHLARYDFACAYVRGQRVLDMACGTGYGTHRLVTHGGAKAAVGVDIDRASVRYARLRYIDDRLDYRVADACESWTDESYGVITSFETIEHVRHPDRMLNSVVQMLQPDGTFLVSTPIRRGGTIKDAPKNPHHLREWAAAEFHKLLGQYFRAVEIYGQNWSTRSHMGPIRLPGFAARLVLRTCGRSGATNAAFHHKVCPLATGPGSLVATGPNIAVAVCTLPRSPSNPAEVHRLCGVPVSG